MARKVISGVSLFAFITCFVLSDVWATTKTNDVVRQDSHKETDAVFANLDIDTFTVPEHLGEVKYSFKGDPSKVIIHVQDAHCNHYAQQKISGIINYLVNEYGIRMVNLEGGVGDYDLSVFTSIAGGAVRREVADYFVKNGEINGAEFYAVNNTEKIRLWGVEDKNLYLENLKVYRDSLEYRTEVNEYLKELTHILNNLKRHIYTQELLKLDIAYCAYKIGDMDFRDYLELLIGKAEERGIEVKKFSNLYLLSQAMELENRIEFEKANRERNVLIDELKKRFSRNEARELVEKSVDFRVKKIKRKAFYGYLLSKAENLGLDMTRFSALSDYMVYVSIYESGDRYKVMDELGEFEKEIKEPLFLNDEQRHLDALSQSLALLSNIFAIRLTKRDYRYYLENKSLFEARNFVNFIREEAPKYGIAARPDVNIARLDDFREDIAKFYEYSFRRDDVFLRNLRFSRGEGDIESAILMTGGFHTENLCELFEKQGISYVSILPKFTSEKNYECPYFNLLAGRFIEVERLLSSALAQVGVMAIASSLNPVLCAYVEGARSRVIFELHVRWSVAVKEGRNGIRIRADGKDIAIIDSRGHDLLSTGKEISEEERETFNVANIEEIISSLGIKSVDFRTPAVEVPVAKETVETVLSPKVEDTPEPEGTAVTKWMKELFRKHMRQMPSWMRKLIAAPVLEELLYRGLPLAVTSILIFFITGELDWQNVMLGSILLQSFSGIKFIKDHYAGERSPPEIIKALLAPTVVTLVNAVILPLIVITPLMFIGLSIFTHMVVNLLVLSMPSLELEAARIPAGVKDSVWEKESVTLSDLVDMGVIGSKNVSTHAMRLYEDKATGEKILLKKAPEHSLRSELIGQRIFEKCGLPVPKMRLIIMDGELILMIKYLEGYQESDGNVLPEGFENDQTLQNG
ncbi:MAG: hypothetical protein KAI70_03730, partial [Candidatus Omnitrophica bacterium]|nr:hypothetical protein [Candidatus Omnitrophota bacterium]